MLYILVVGVLFLWTTSPCPAQSSTPLMGARGQAMGNATACLSDEWSMLNNVAGVARASAASLAVSYDAFPILPAFAKMGFTATVPGRVAGGIAVYRFGDEAYSEQILSAGIATRWSHTSLGIKVNHIRYAATGLGSKSVWSASFGGITALTSWMTVGAHITNVNQPWLSKQFDERLPTTVTVGFLFALASQVIVATEIEKRINDRATGRLGMECTVHKKVKARLGVQINPQTLSGGLGFQLRYFVLDCSSAYTQSLGTRHQASFIFTFKKKNSKESTKSAS